MPLTDYSNGPNLDGEREKIVSISVAGCFSAVMNSRKAEGVVLYFPLGETPAWLCEAARSTASLHSTISRFVTTSMSFPCLATIGVLILAFSLSSFLKSPYTCEQKIVTGLPWVSFQLLLFCVVVSGSSLSSALYLIMRSCCECLHQNRTICRDGDYDEHLVMFLTMFMAYSFALPSH